MEQKDILTNMKENQIPIESVRMIGGATNSRIWNQMQADMYKLPCDTLAVEDAAVTGAALMGGAAVGLFRDIRDGVRNMVKVKEHFEPIPEHAEIYDEMYQIYCRAYESLEQEAYLPDLQNCRADIKSRRGGFSMTSRERVRMALNHQEPDRVPVDLWGSASRIHTEQYKKIAAYLGLEPRESDLLRPGPPPSTWISEFQIR